MPSTRPVRLLLFAAVAGCAWGSGTSVILVLGALFGLVWSLGHGFPHRLRAPFVAVGGLYAMLLAVDFLNGGGVSNLMTTGLAYSPFLMAPLFAVALIAGRLDTANMVLPVSAGLAVLTAVALVMTRFNSEGHATGLDFGPLGLGFLISLWLLLVMAHLAFGTGARVAAGVAAVLGVVALVATLSKAVVLAFICGLAILVALRTADRARGRGLAALATLLLGVILGAGLAMGPEWVHDAGSLRRLLSEGQSIDSSVGLRFEMYYAGTKAFLAAPLLGHGLENQIAAALEYERPSPQSFEEFFSLHNEYVVHAVSFGIFGLLFLLGFLVLLGGLAGGQKTPGIRAWGWSLVAFYTVFMMFDHTFNYGPLTGPAAVVLAMLMAFRAAERTDRDERRRMPASPGSPPGSG